MSEVFENLDRMMQKEASERNPVRAITAAQIEADQKFSSFLENDRESRLAFLDDDIQTIAQKYANEYNVDSDVVYKGVVHFLAQKSSNYDDYEPRDYDDYMDSNDYAGMESWYQDLLDQGHSPEEARAIIQHEQSVAQPHMGKTVSPTKAIGGKEENTKYKNWTVKQKDKNLGLEKQDVSPPTEHVREFFQPQGDAPYSHFDDEPGGKTPYKADAKEEDITKKTGPEPKIQSKSSTEDGDYFLDIKQSAKIDHNYRHPTLHPDEPYFGDPHGYEDMQNIRADENALYHPSTGDADLGDYLQIREDSMNPNQLRAPERGERYVDDNFGGMSDPDILQSQTEYYHDAGPKQYDDDYDMESDWERDQYPWMQGELKGQHQQKHMPYPGEYKRAPYPTHPQPTERQQAIRPYSHLGLGDPAVDWFAMLKQHVSNIKNKLESIDYSRPGR